MLPFLSGDISDPDKAPTLELSLWFRSSVSRQHCFSVAFIKLGSPLGHDMEHSLYNSSMKCCSSKSFLTLTIMWKLYCLSLAGCITEAQTVLSPKEESSKVLLIERIIVTLTGERARRFEPTMREVELIEQTSGARYRLTIEGNDQLFTVFLPPGHYEIVRAQISEGPFLSIAQLESSFSLLEDHPLFVGTWRFGVDSPRYGRMVLVSMALDGESLRQAEETMRKEYPTLASKVITPMLPIPKETQTRLYEVAPYPRISRYFRRHYW